MIKPTYEDTLDYLFDEVIKPFKASHEFYEPSKNQLIYISTADRHDNPFVKMIQENLKEK